jgi:hypothetical protein
MAHMEFFVVSEDVSIDQQTNRLSLFNVLEQLAMPNFPFMASAVAVSLWVAEDGDDGRDFQCMLRVFLPDGNSRDFTTNFTFRGRRHRVIQRILGFTINEPGMLRFEVLLNGEHKASHKVDVLRIDLSELPPTAQAG